LLVDLGRCLPAEDLAAVAVPDAFHVVKLATQLVDEVRSV
jgi:hypothetical protein